VRSANAAADADAKCLRLSIDTKANVALGEFSRRGKARGEQALRALDHDLATKEKLVPVGILEVASGQLELTFATSSKTSDLLADSLEGWWRRRGPELSHLEELLINSDNGPESNGKRSQFLARLTAFADWSGLRIRLVYYPPYHSKYNPIERCWGVLEKHWNGALLRDEATALGWAKTMTWKGAAPVVNFTRKLYKKGVRLQGQARRALEARLQRSPTLRWWDILIEPRKV
jgi:transposase